MVKIKTFQGNTSDYTGGFAKVPRLDDKVNNFIEEIQKRGGRIINIKFVSSVSGDIPAGGDGVLIDYYAAMVIYDI